MPLVENDHVIETLAANGADNPFDERTLPRRTGRRQNLVDTKSRDAAVEVPAVDSISVPYQVPRRRVPWKSIDHLLRRPLGGRMFRDIEMSNTATIVTEDDEDEQYPEGCSRHSEEVDRHQVA